MLKSKTVTYDGQEVTVIGDTRGTALYESMYKRRLFTIYPEAGAFNQAMNALTPTEDSAATKDAFSNAAGKLLVSDELGSRFYTRINQFAVLASHIKSTVGTEWIGKAPMVDSDLRLAFEHFLEEEYTEGLWVEVQNAVIELSSFAEEAKGELESVVGS